MDTGFIYALSGFPMAVGATEGLSLSLRFLQSHSEVFALSLSTVEAEKVHFNNYPRDAEANSPEPHTENWCKRMPEKHLPPSLARSSVEPVL